MSFSTQHKVEDYSLPLLSSHILKDENLWSRPFPPSLGVSYFLLWRWGNLTSTMRWPDLHLWITVGLHQYSRSRPLHKLLYSPSFSPSSPLVWRMFVFPSAPFLPSRLSFARCVFIWARRRSIILKLRERWKNSLMVPSWIFITSLVFCCSVWKHDSLNIPREGMH